MAELAPASTVSTPVNPFPGTETAALSIQSPDVQKRIQDTVSRIGRNPTGQEEQELVYRATFSPDELKQLGLDQQFQQLQQQTGLARDSLLATPAPTRSKLRVLEEALNAKSTVTNQQLGESDLYKEAGLGGYAVLNQSLAQRSNEMTTKYNSFKSKVSDVSQAMTDTYNLALDRYGLLKDEMDAEDAKYQGFIEEANQYERAINLMQEQHRLDKEMFNLKQSAAERAAAAKTKAGVFSAEAPIAQGGSFTNRITGTGTITSNLNTDVGSSAWEWGLDVAAPQGSALYSPGAGKVIKIEGGHASVGVNNKEGLKQNSGFGNQVKIDLGGGKEVWVSHLDSVNPDLFVGQELDPGQIIGTVGNTGYTMGQNGFHADITMKDGGKYLKPSEVKRFIEGEMGTVPVGAGDLLQKAGLGQFKNIIEGFLPSEIGQAYFSQIVPQTAKQEGESQQLQPLFDVAELLDDDFLDIISEEITGLSKAKAKVAIQQKVNRMLKSDLEVPVGEEPVALKDYLAPSSSDLQKLTDYQLEFLYNLTQEAIENMKGVEDDIKERIKESMNTTTNLFTQ